MNNKFIFFLLLLKVSLQWHRCLDRSHLAVATNRVSHTATVVGDDFYLIGGILSYGYDPKRPNRNIYKITYNSCEDIKYELKGASVDIYDHAAVYIPDGELKNCILVFGGKSVLKQEYESIFYYNISSDRIGNITSADYSYISSKAYYIKEMNKVALVGGYSSEDDHTFNSISYFDLNSQEIESYNNRGFDSAKRYSFSSSLNEIEGRNGNKYDIITYFGGYNQYGDYTTTLYVYNTTIPTNYPVKRDVDGPDLNREFSKGVGWRNYLVFHGGTFHYSSSFYLAEKTLLYDINRNKMLEVKDEHLGVWRHDNIIIKKDMLLIVGGANTRNRMTDYFVLNLSTASLQDATEDVFNPLMYYLIGAAAVVFVGICMCCCLYCVLSNIARRRYERQAIGIERMLNGEPPRTVPEDLLNVITKDNYSPNKFHHQTCCTICILEFELDEKIKVLPCQHIFHPECIDQWLHHKDICPVCKREVLNERGSRIASTVAWEENSVDEISIKQNDNQQQQTQELEMGNLNNHKTSRDSITINVAPAGSGTNLPRQSNPNRLSSPNRTSTPNTTSRRQVVTPNSISVQNNSANNSINNSIHFQPPNMPFEDMSGL